MLSEKGLATRDYKVVSDNPVVEDLLCEHEVGNPHDMHTVAGSYKGSVATVSKLNSGRTHYSNSVCSIFLVKIIGRKILADEFSSAKSANVFTAKVLCYAVLQNYFLPLSN